jgi:hypothetical protein
MPHARKYQVLETLDKDGELTCWMQWRCKYDGINAKTMKMLYDNKLIIEKKIEEGSEYGQSLFNRAFIINPAPEARAKIKELLKQMERDEERYQRKKREAEDARVRRYQEGHQGRRW